jgi:hypothetical protein
MHISTEVINSPVEFSKIAAETDVFLEKHSENPFMLSQFIKPAMRLNTRPNHVPAVLVSRANGEIIGVSQVLFRRFLGFQAVTFLLKDSLSPDFVFESSYRKEALAHIVNLLLKKMKCHSLSLTFPVESPNLPTLDQLCHRDKIYHNREISLAKGHRVLPICCSWADFQKKQGRNFRKRFRVAERDLDRAGKWGVSCIENVDDQNATFVLQKILSIEEGSWKQTWRSQIGQVADSDLLWAWTGALSLVKENPQFKLYVWFLDLNGQSVAYSMIFQYKQVAIGAKTSFVEKYRKLGLGVYLTNVAIRGLFDGKRVRQFDFLTNLPHMSVWTHTCLPRVTYTVNTITPFAVPVQVFQNFKKTRTAHALIKKLNSKNLFASLE